MYVLDFGRIAWLTVIFWFRVTVLSGATTVGSSIKKRRAHLLARYLISMGPLYIKAGQILATRSDLVSPDFARELKKLQDDVPGIKGKEAEKAIERALGESWRNKFEGLSFTPIASASIAQVHLARLPEGTEVAVKLVKPGVRAQLDRNLKVMRAIVRALNFASGSFRQLDVSARLEEIGALLLEQTNMLREAANQETIYRNMVGHPYLRIPAVHRRLCTEDILVMEYMTGIPGKRVANVCYPRNQVARRFQDAIYTMLYMHGVCHGDPHPGNVMFLDTGEIILLDFGITVYLTEDEKWGLSSFYYACTRKEWELAVSRFTEHFVLTCDKRLMSDDTYRSKLTAVLKKHFEDNTNQWSTVAYFRDVNAVLQQFGAQYTTSFTKVELVFFSCEGFAKEIDNDIDIWANARSFTDRYSPYMSKEVRRRFQRFFSNHMPESMRLKDEAGKTLVAPTHIHRYFFPSAYPLFVEHAAGAEITDFDGNSYIDLSGGYGPHILGYGHPSVQQGVERQLQAGMVNAIGNFPEVRLSQLLVEAFPAADKAILCNSGTEANLLAIRLCRAYTKRRRVAKFEGHFHGWSDIGMVSSWFRFRGSKMAPQPVSGTEGSDSKTVEDTLVLQYGCEESLDRLRRAAGELACVVCEPMPSSVALVDEGFLKDLRKTCDEVGVPLVFDEVVTGFRVDYGGAQTLAGVEPDLTCLGKIIGGGLPCGAVVGRQQLIEIAKSSDDPFVDYETKAFVGGTMSGNSLSCAAGVGALEYLREHVDVYSELRQKTQWLKERLEDVARGQGIAIRVAAFCSIFSLTFSHRASRFYREKQAGSNFKANIALAYYMRKYGVYMPELHSFLLSGAHTQEQLEKVAEAFENSLKEMLGEGMFVS